MNENTKDTAWTLVFLCWLIASVSALGTIFFSEIMNYPPCELCWYQRIFMYPLVIIFLVGILSFDKAVLKYSLPIVIIGWLVSIYHNLIYYKIIPESAAPCVEGVSCTAEYIKWFGFITIPLLSLFSFTLLLILLTILYRKMYK